MIMVPAWTPTDLASIPRIFRAMLDQNGTSRKPAVLHDYLYSSQEMTRAKADALFRRALQSECEKVVRNLDWRGYLDRAKCWSARWTYWAGVRLGGWIVWRSRRED